MVAKLCRSPGCDELAEPGKAHCPDCGQVKAAREAVRKQAAKRASSAWSHLYQSGWWKRNRLTFLKAEPLCRSCAEVGLVVAAREVDHIEPHRGDMGKFRDKANWQPLCTPCHSRKTAREVMGKGEGGRVPPKGHL